MAYIRYRAALGMTEDQQKALIQIPMEEIQAIPAEERLRLSLRRQEVKAAEKSARWDAISSFASVLVPITTILGISLVRNGRNNK